MAESWQIGWIILFTAILFHLRRLDLLAAIYVITNPINEHSQILSPAVSRTLWITGILFPFLHWVWNSISGGLRDHTQPLTSFHCTVIMPMFQTHSNWCNLIWRSEKAAKADTDPKSASINNAYSAHANYEALITLLSLGWLHFIATIKVADRLAGRGIRSSVKKLMNDIRDHIMLHAFLLHSSSLTFKWLYLFVLVSRCGMDRVVWEAWQSEI